jgi:hypothetical protein
MSIMDILRSYAERPTDTHQDFDEVAKNVPPAVLGQGIAEAFRSERTPDFGQMAADLFSRSDASQRSGLLSQLLQAVGSGGLSTLAGGALARLLQSHGAKAPDSAPTVVTPDMADRVTPDEVREVAAAAREKDPGIMDRVGAYYAQHPEVVKVLGGAALAIALGKIAGGLQK